jgi:hypothetical protein
MESHKNTNAMALPWWDQMPLQTASANFENESDIYF